jgi:hypothetical protein
MELTNQLKWHLLFELKSLTFTNQRDCKVNVFNVPHSVELTLNFGKKVNSKFQEMKNYSQKILMQY